MNKRICVFSQRNLGHIVSRSLAYEFEDIICKLDNVDMIAPKLYYDSDSFDFYNFGKSISNWIARKTNVKSINPGIRKSVINNKYELFIAFFQFPNDISSINSILKWRDNSKIAICWLDDIWLTDVKKYTNSLKMLSRFDIILTNYYYSIPTIKNIVGRPCVFMAPGVDMKRFCSYPNPPVRNIDVYSMGHRSPIMHKEFLELSERGEIFYIYDTIKKLETLNPSEHRNLVANIAKRSKYFITYLPKQKFEKNAIQQMEFGYRYFEGAGAGTVMIGEAPDCDLFKQYFDWDDAVINIPYDTTNAINILAELDKDKIRIQFIRKINTIQSLLRNDWVYRWEDILKLVGMKATPSVAERELFLRQLADEVYKT